MTLDNKILEVWHQKEIHYPEDYYDNGFLMSFEGLRRECDLSAKLFLLPSAAIFSQNHLGTRASSLSNGGVGSNRESSVEILLK